MKLLQLDLLRYGHLAGLTLTFPPDVALHVVHGANEAGKSTALAAIADALFGFARSTSHDFLYPAAQLRVGVTLQAAGRGPARFIRRKGLRDTLRDADDQPVADEVLQGFLGGASRELFERGFGLNGERLRRGSDELLRSGGETGASLLAGSGLLSLQGALDRLNSEAKSLVGDGRGQRRLSLAVQTWSAAQAAAEDRAIKPAAWLEAIRLRDAAQGGLDDIHGEIQALAAEQALLQRVRRVAPLLARLDALRNELAELADAAVLPPNAEARRQAVVAGQHEAARDLDRETLAAAGLAEQREKLAPDETVLAVQDGIDALSAQRPLAVQAAADLPSVRAAVAGCRAAVADALRDLGSALTPEAARDAMPPAPARRAVQRLISDHGRLTTTARDAVASLASAHRRRDAAAVALRAAPAPPSPKLLRQAIEAVRAEGRLDVESARAARALRDAEAAVGVALAALPLWHGDLAGLLAARLPLQGAVDAAATRLAEAEADLADSRAKANVLAQDIDMLEADISRLASGETVPTPDAVAAARWQRDRVWRLFRAQAEGHAPDTELQAGLLAGQADGNLADLTEALRDEADRLADRRFAEARRVTEYLAVTARHRLLCGRLPLAETTLRIAETEAASTRTAWQTLWLETGVVAAPPAAMTEWRRARAEVLGLADAARAAGGKCHELAVQMAQARALLAGLVPGGLDATLAALLLHAETHCAAGEAAAAIHAEKAQAVALEEKQLPELQEAAEHAAASLVEWQREWGAAIDALWLPAEASVEAADAALTAWTVVAEQAPAWRRDAQRVADMESCVRDFDAAARALHAGLGAPSTDEPPASLAAALVRRLSFAREAAAEAARLTQRITGIHLPAAEDAKRRKLVADTALQELRTAAGVADDAALEAAIARATRRAAAAAAVADLTPELQTAGDGADEATLRREATGHEPGQEREGAVARLSDIEIALATLGERREQLSAQRARADAQLADMQHGHDAATAAQEAEDALAEARVTAERYACLHLARTLLRAGLARFRSDQQDPLLRAASAHFAALTTSRYLRLGEGEDSDGRSVLVAERADGTTCPVGALSEGTRDQMYLALRIAAIQRHASQAEPLPFIADDLLVHFDDERAAAAIATLAGLGRSTPGASIQTILFTHHDHIVHLASRQPGVAVQKLAAISPAQQETAQAGARLPL